MKSIKNAQNELDALKNDVIGLFKMRNSNVFELVVNCKETNQTIDVIRITHFGAIQQEFNLPTHFGRLSLFPDNKNMNDMLSNPFEFDAFIKSFK
jgi:LEA14-like dessication related protein